MATNRAKQHADAVQQELIRGLDGGERRQLQTLLVKLLGPHPTQPV